MSVSCNDCSTKVDRLKTGWELLGQGNVVPDGDCNVMMILIMMVSVIASLIKANDYNHLRKTTRCIAVRNSSRERHPSLDTSDKR